MKEETEEEPLLHSVSFFRVFRIFGAGEKLEFGRGARHRLD